MSVHPAPDLLERRLPEEMSQVQDQHGLPVATAPWPCRRSMRNSFILKEIGDNLV